MGDQGGAKPPGSACNLAILGPKSCNFMSKLPSPFANEEKIYEQVLFSKFLSKVILIIM